MKNDPSIFQGNDVIPDRLFFTINFYDFPTFKTDIISYSNKSNLKKVLFNNECLILEQENNSSEPIYKFNFDFSKPN